MGVMSNKTSGQMTIEFVVAFPAMLAVAFVAINAVLFFFRLRFFRPCI